MQLAPSHLAPEEGLSFFLSSEVKGQWKGRWSRVASVVRQFHGLAVPPVSCVALCGCYDSVGPFPLPHVVGAPDGAALDLVWQPWQVGERPVLLAAALRPHEHSSRLLGSVRL